MNDPNITSTNTTVTNLKILKIAGDSTGELYVQFLPDDTLIYPLSKLAMDQLERVLKVRPELASLILDVQRRKGQE